MNCGIAKSFHYSDYSSVSYRFNMAKSIILSVFVLCIFGFVSCEKVTVKDCGSVMSTVKEVDITPCPKQPCELHKGSEETIEVTFTPNENITAATTVVYGQIGPATLPFPVDQPDACKDQGITCPMTAGKDYTFKTVLPIKSMYPKVRVVVKWEMQDQNKNMVYCWEVAAQIVD